MLDTQAIIYRPRLSQNRRLVLGVLGVIVMAYLLNFMLGFPIKVGLVLAAQIFLYVLLFHRPVWAMAALMVGQLTLSNYMFTLGGQLISVRFFWAILTLLLLVPILSQKGGIKLGSGAKRIIIPAVILSCMATIANYVNIDLPYAVQYLRQEFIWLVILFLLPAAVKNERDLKRLALVALITGSVSAIFALIQYYAPALRESYEGRIVGLTTSPVHLGFILPVIILPMVAIYFLKGVNSRTRKIFILLIIVMTLALYFTYTRTGMYSLAPAILLMAFMMKGKPKKVLLLFLLIAGAAFLLFVNTTGNRYSQGFSEESSAAGRLVLWQAGATIALDYPLLGIGSYRFREMSLEYASTVDPSLMETQGAGTALGRYAAHNDFITVWTSFGTVALLAYLWLFVGIFRNFVDASRHSRTRFLKAFTIGCLGAMVAYIVNAATHNVMSSSMLIWILGGLSIAATKITLSKRFSKVKEIP